MSFFHALLHKHVYKLLIKEDFTMIYGDIVNENATTLDQELRNPNALLEAFLLDDLGRMHDEERESVIESAEMEMLVTEGMIGKRTLVKLSKEDDLFRRKKIICLQMAKEKGDHLYDEVIKYRMRERKAMGMIMKKYGYAAERTAKVGQKEYLKKIPIGSKSTMRSIANPEGLTKNKVFDANTGMNKTYYTKPE
jgi:hypothetical protein